MTYDTKSANIWLKDQTISGWRTEKQFQHWQKVMTLAWDLVSDAPNIRGQVLLENQYLVDQGPGFAILSRNKPLLMVPTEDGLCGFYCSKGSTYSMLNKQARLIDGTKYTAESDLGVCVGGCYDADLDILVSQSEEHQDLVLECTRLIFTRLKL